MKKLLIKSTIAALAIEIIGAAVNLISLQLMDAFCWQNNYMAASGWAGVDLECC